MKQLGTITAVFCLLVGCQKEVTGPDAQGRYLQRVQASLQDSMQAVAWADLDFSRAVQTTVPSDTIFLRIPFKGKDLSNEFALLQTDRIGNIRHGRLVHLEAAERKRGGAFNGTITLRHLNGTVLFASAIQEGYVVVSQPSRVLTRTRSEHARGQGVTSLEAPTYKAMPEVIVVGYRRQNGDITFSDWVNLQSLSGSSGGSTGSGYYGALGGSGGTGGSAATGGSNGGSRSTRDGQGRSPLQQERALEIEAEYIYHLPGIDLRKIFRCFDYIPNAGATYRISLCVDLPSNNEPDVSTNSAALNPGHTFLTVTKANAGVSVSQSFGFYPKTAPSLFDPLTPVSPTLKDNGGQEINASIEMPLSEAQFTSLQQKALTWSLNPYRLADYNCTNYALDLFNSLRTNPIAVQPYRILLPGGTNSYNVTANQISVAIDKSPQMLFLKLQELKSANSVEAPSIQISKSHTYRASISKGECD